METAGYVAYLWVACWIGFVVSVTMVSKTVLYGEYSPFPRLRSVRYLDYWVCTGTKFCHADFYIVFSSTQGSTNSTPASNTSATMILSA